MRETIPSSSRSDANPGYVNFLGQRYHASVALSFVGLGIVVGSGIRGIGDDGKLWASVLGLLSFFGGMAWRIGVRRRSECQNSIRADQHPPN